ncbi:peptidoglycan DD-metalloendopeptidase family protein [Microbacterium sp. SD291]|uniref:M23 family metallopeptidase n=1 Tax=Microbacterium sp. SD291 TaxID=2782007 RepID=UPI0027DBF9D5|nr:peptidoglycan DD-metalloendopeptidase family protein [Microbacterium sp. SD291]
MKAVDAEPVAASPVVASPAVRPAVARPVVPEPVTTRPVAETVAVRPVADAPPAEVIDVESAAPEAEPAAPSAPAEPAAPASAPADEAPVDAFEQAARAFRSGVAGSTPAPDAAGHAEPDAADDLDAENAHVVRRRPGLRKIVTVGATVGVMSLAGLLAVSMTLPAEAVAAAQGASALSATSLVAPAADEAAAADDEIQAFVTSSDVQNSTLARSDSFSTVSLIEVAAEEGINYSNEVFTNDPDAAIQWPFKVGVAMSSGYGMRWGRLHEGIDFVPGEGAPIQAIADGTVRIATEQGGAFGVTVYIDHVIDGQIVTSHYSHMQYGSLQVEAGQSVKVGDVVGHTGNTGRSYGAHLHFEIIINGGTVDPMPWLRENAGRYEY